VDGESVNFGGTGVECFDLHLRAAARTGEGVDFEYLFDKARPGRGGFEDGFR